MSIDAGFPNQHPGAQGLHAAWYEANVAAGAPTAQRCGCGVFRMPARYRCAACGSPEWRFEPVGTVGTIVSWTITHRPFHFGFAEAVPYAVLIVEVPEGVRFFVHARPGIGRLEDLDRDSLIGRAVTLGVDGHGVPFARF